jgi:phosphodiesterase/alkaline phosphatase D-like protein
MLRYVSETEATVWVETDAACVVEVLGRRARTFQIAGHHYAIVSLEGLAPGAAQPYRVALDGVLRWPEPGLPPSQIRTQAPGNRAQIAFGSCRVSAPNHPPYSLAPDEDARGLGIDALRALGLRLLAQPGTSWPDLLLLLGDQVYADEGDGVADFEGYTQLYRQAWSEPVLRWLFSTLPTAMIFDDHELHDDWNTSEAWVNEMRAKPWWERRVTGAFMSYWIYQHLGNLSPQALGDDQLLQQIVDGEDGTALLRAFALRASHETDGSQWSYSRTIGTTRLVVIDSRAGRVLRNGRRSMLDEQEWQWLERQATGDVDHLLLATSVPLLLTHGVHDLEAWNEAVCAGAWGSWAARLGERIRQRFDLEHWSAFEESFKRLVGIIHAVATGQRGAAPATIVVLSGDVHHAYFAQAWFPGDASVKSRVYQAVCSPIRNQLNGREQRAVRVAMTKPATVLARALARSAGVRPPGIRWRLDDETLFENQIGTLMIEARAAQLTIERAVDEPDPTLEPVLRRQLD